MKQKMGGGAFARNRSGLGTAEVSIAESLDKKTTSHMGEGHTHDADRGLHNQKKGNQTRIPIPGSRR